MELQTLRTHVSDVNGVSLTQALALAFSVRNDGKCCKQPVMSPEVQATEQIWEESCNQKPSPSFLIYKWFLIYKYEGKDNLTEMS